MCLSEKEPTLEIVHLGTNSLSDEGLRVIVTGLQSHVKLRELYLGKLFPKIFSINKNLLLPL